MQTVLLVDDEAEVRAAIRRTLQVDGYNILEASDGLEGLDVLKQHDVQVILSDQRMPEVSGSDFLAFAAQSYPNTVRMIMSGYTDFCGLKGAVNNGSIYKYLDKPWDNDMLRKHVKDAFVKQKENLISLEVSSFYNETGHAILTVDSEGNVKSANSAAESVMGYDRESIYGVNIFTEYFSEDTRKRHEVLTCVSRQSKWQSVISIRHVEGAARQYSISITAKKDSAAEGSRYIVVLSDISTQTNSDALTGLSSRVSLLTQMDSDIQGVRRQERCAFIAVGINKFSDIETSLGHSVSEHITKVASKRLVEVTPSCFALGLINNATFGLWLPVVDKAMVVDRLLQKLVEAFNEPIMFHQEEINVSVKMGVAFLNKDLQAEKLIQNAVTAMENTRLTGGSFSHYTKQMSTALQENWIIESDLEKAIDKNQLDIQYQPIVDLSNGNVVAAEALARWRHPQWGNIPPDKFIPIAEQNNLIQDIGLWVLRKACMDTNSLHERGHDGIKASVNVSVKQLISAEFSNRVEQTLADVGFSPDRLVLEITESHLLSQKESALGSMLALSELGVCFSLDDFGTGYSSLGHLRSLPFDSLKIDKSFVFGLSNSSVDKVIVTNILDLANRTGLSVVAEGIETIEQLDILTQLNCDYGQGFHMSRPLSIDKFIDILESDRWMVF